MGEQHVKQDHEGRSHQEFMRALLNEVRVLEHMLYTGKIESGIRRIGAEQEMFIVDRAFGPACKASEILQLINDPRFTHELGLFNLEANLSPRLLQGDCLRRMEQELEDVYRRAQSTARKLDCDIALVGILPSLRLENLGLDSMVPLERYKALNDAMRSMRDEDFRLVINGID